MSTWNAETAQWYANKYGEYATNRLCINELEFEADSTVVDIGCGTGSALRHASSQVTHGILIGIDPVPRMIEIAREQTAIHSAHDRIKFYQGAAESLPVEKGCADFVLAFDSFDHWENPLQGLSEVLRILANGGQFVVVKDAEVPHGFNAKSEFSQSIQHAGFKIIKERFIEDENVSFTFWVCVPMR